MDKHKEWQLKYSKMIEEKMYKGKNVFIGIDNGVSGSIGVLSDYDEIFIETPVKRHLKYTKKKAYLNRVDHKALKEFLYEVTHKYENVFIKLERPMINPKRFVATTSALRALEATLIVLEELELGFEFIDSKEWQKAVLPKGIKGAPALKEASMLKGVQLYPKNKELITKHKDADGLLIAHYIKGLR